jgi:hypothetical protein
MTKQTHHLKLPILTILCVSCSLSLRDSWLKIRNEPKIPILVSPGPSVLGALGSWVPGFPGPSVHGALCSWLFCTNEPIFQMALSTITSNKEIAYDQNPSNGIQKNEAN